MKSIKFKKSWSDAIAQFPPEVRCEIYAATLFYFLENRVPADMSDLARGAFAFLKMEIDAARLRASRRLGQAVGQTGDTAENTRTEPLGADDN
ncbi:MAG: hypothetical protein K2F63_06400, partial [Muribaculaceae bacterium]|nr:hypothetical protein [Muribaculaceae bacterium]